MKKTDVIIIGAGMAGLTLAALLGKRGLKIAVVDREDPGMMATDAFDSRTVALSAGSRDILAPLNIWADLEPSGQAITAIDVQEGHDPFLLNFNADATRNQAFGWIFPNSIVRRVLYDAARKHGVTFIQDGLKDIQDHGDHVVAQLRTGASLSAPLLVGADGRQSRVRALCGIDTVDLDYKQTALVGLVTHEKPHSGLALERFYPDGPFAVLPFTDDADGRHRSAIVWTRHHKNIDPCLRKGFGQNRNACASEHLAGVTHDIAPFFDERYGAVQAIGRWAAFPLTLHHAKEFIAPRVALISDAAHAIHPIAGQGLNLGMRDVAVLADLLGSATGDTNNDFGAPELLREYQIARRGDVLAMVAATDLLNRLFGNALPGLRHVRSLGLGLVNRLPPLKKFFMNVAMGQK